MPSNKYAHPTTIEECLKMTMNRLLELLIPNKEKVFNLIKSKNAHVANNPQEIEAEPDYVQKRLAEYSKDIGISGITLDELISSHKDLRARNSRSHKELIEEIKQAREHAAAQTAKDLTERGWLSVERLKQMTFGEISEMIENAE